MTNGLKAALVAGVSLNVIGLWGGSIRSVGGIGPDITRSPRPRSIGAPIPRRDQIAV